jgi:hypothetical protein
MHVIVVRDRLQAMFLLRAQQDFISDGSAERSDAAAGEIRERAQPRGVRVGTASTSRNA